MKEVSGYLAGETVRSRVQKRAPLRSVQHLQFMPRIVLGIRWVNTKCVYTTCHTPGCTHTAEGWQGFTFSLHYRVQGKAGGAQGPEVVYRYILQVGSIG